MFIRMNSRLSAWSAQSRFRSAQTTPGRHPGRQVGTNVVQVGTNRPQVGKKSRSAQITPMFSMHVSKCAGREGNLQSKLFLWRAACLKPCHFIGAGQNGFRPINMHVVSIASLN